MAEVICSTAPFFLRPVREAFRHIADAGFTGVEVMVTRDPETQDPVSLFAAAEEHGLRVRAVHAPFLLVARRVWDTDPITKVRRAAEMADILGASTVIAHLPYRWQSGYARWLTEERPAVAAERGVTIAVENMFSLSPLGLRGPSLHDEAPLQDAEHRVFDTSHAAVAGLDLQATAAAWGERLAHIHLSNNRGRGWDSHLPVDEGVLDLRGFLTSLPDYTGVVSLELDLRRFMRDDRAMNDVLVRNREFCTAASPTPLPLA